MTGLRSFEVDHSRGSDRNHSFLADDDDDDRPDDSVTSPTHSNPNFGSDLYRPLVNESPPANFATKTPQDDHNDPQKSATPPSVRRSNPGTPSDRFTKSPLRRELRTPSEWDELFRSKGLDPEVAVEERVQKEASPKIKVEPSSKVEPSPRIKQEETHSTQQRETVKAVLPSYMRGTVSYESRLHSLEHPPAPKPSTAMRIRQPKNAHRFKSSTRINAMEDIHSEMKDEDVYVPLAARIRLFEQSLRGGGTGPARSQTNALSDTHRSSGSSSSLTRPRSPKLLTSHRSSSSQRLTPQIQLSQEKRQPLINSSPNTRESHHPRANRTRSSGVSGREPGSSITRADHSNTSKVASESERITQNASKKQKTAHRKTTVQPFRFATDERALHHQKTFKAKLDLWKKKEQQILEDAKKTVHAAPPQRQRGTKRKAQE